MSRTLYVCLAGGLVVAAALGACAAPGKSTFPGADGGGILTGDGGISLSPDSGSLADTGTITFQDSSVANSTCSDGLMTITVSPPTTSLMMPYSATQAPLTQALTAQGTFMDGSTQDVTGCAVWSVSPFGPVTAPTTTVKNGAFSTTSPGVFTVTVGAVASKGSTTAITGTATITVVLTGTVVSGGVATTSLDGTPSGTAPTIAYPLDNSLFPFNFGDLGWQIVPSSAAFTTGRIAFVGDAISLNVYAPCTPIAGATTANACSIAIPASLEASLANVSQATNLTETVRVSDGTNVAESSPISVRWATNPLVGTIYYWSTPPMGGSGSSGASEIIRMNLETPATPPEVFLTNLDAIPYGATSATSGSPLSGGWACIGCHAVSHDGKKLGITIGGASVNANGDGNGSFFALIDVGSKIPISARVVDSNNQLLADGFAELSTFSESDAGPAGDYMVQELQGQLYLRTADVNLTSTPLFASMTESMTQPYWSYKGDLLTFASWVPTLTIPHAYDSKDLNGNETPNAQIWTATSSGTTFGTPSLLVPRATGLTEYYPTVSEDSSLVVFDESSCSGPVTSTNDGYGGSPCDGYDDPSAHLRLVSASGGTPVNLDKASQRTSAWPTTSTWTNSWPRFAPPAPTGTPPSTYQGKTLYWIAFSSRLPYGATLTGSQDGSTPPQIWFAAVAVDPSGTLTVDPSFAPVWLPQQNNATPEILIDGGVDQTVGGDGKPTGNHVPQWVYQYVPYVPPPPPPDGGAYIPPPPPK